MDQAALDAIVRAFRDADHVLVAAGAGMSAAAGLDYTDEADFARVFPAFRRWGMTARYQAIGFFGWPPEVHWGYWATHVMDARFGPRNDAAYRDLLAYVGNRDSFVFTSNVDRLFPRNGFAPDRLFTPQGDYGYLQCLRGCRPVVWDSRPFMEAIVADLDPDTQSIRDRALVPRCPHCGGDVFLNVRIDRHFVETPYREQGEAANLWLDRARKGRLLVVEVGAAFNTPSVIRWPCDGIVAQTPGATLVRLNRDQPDVPATLGPRAIGIGGDAASVIHQSAPRLCN